ncbi:MAG: DegT/DnrJ/EryC1/StrS aminotransferase family protein [Bauldia sp.]
MSNALANGGQAPTAARASSADRVERGQEVLRPFYLDLDEAEIRAIEAATGDILRRGELILGRHTAAFEAAFAAYVDSRHAVALNTATSALEVLLTLRGARGRKVAVPSNTNFASVAAILRAGGQPVYMDMAEEYFSPGLAELGSVVAKHRVDGVLWVHIGGLIVPDFPAVVAFCRDRGLFLIEDAAHAHGSRLGGRSAGTFADGGAFSFFPTKVMTTIEGGMITTDSDSDAELARSFRNQGKRGAAYGGLHHDLGSSWRMSEVSAFIGLVQLAKLDRMVAARRRAVDIVSARLRGARIGYCDASHMDQASHYKFIVRLPEGVGAEEAKRKLAAEGIVCGGGVYEVPCHRQPVFAGIAYDEDALRVTETWCPRHICPPITSGTTPQDAERIAVALTEVLG